MKGSTLYATKLIEDLITLLRNLQDSQLLMSDQMKEISKGEAAALPKKNPEKPAIKQIPTAVTSPSTVRKKVPVDDEPAGKKQFRERKLSLPQGDDKNRTKQTKQRQITKAK